MEHIGFYQAKPQWYHDRVLQRGFASCPDILALADVATAGINKLTFGKCSEILGKEKVEMPIIAIFKSNVLHGTTDFIMLLVSVWTVAVFLMKLALEM